MQQAPTAMAPLTEYEAQRQRNIERNCALLRELDLSSPFASITTTTPKAARAARKSKAPSRGAVVAPPRGKSARITNKKAGITAPDVPFDRQGTPNDKQPSSSDEDEDSARNTAEEPLVSTKINFVYDATSETKDICTRCADGTVDDNFLMGVTNSIPPTLEAGSAVEATPTTNQPRVATEGDGGSAGIAPDLNGSRPPPLPPGPTKKKLEGNARKIARAKRFGSAKVPVGIWCARRADFHDNLVHLPTMAGIFGDPDRGAYSVAVSGGYEDNVDRGDSFTFTGEGGKIVNKRKKRGSLCSTKPNAPQSLTKGNMALYRSCQTGKPVRVIRGENSSWEGAPKKGYRYDGLYQVRKVWQQQGLSGFPVFQFALVRIAGQPDINISTGPGSLLADRLASAAEKLETNETK